MCMLIRVPDNYHLQVWDIDQSCLVYQSAILSGMSHLSVLKTFVAPIIFSPVNLLLYYKFLYPRILGRNFD